MANSGQSVNLYNRPIQNAQIDIFAALLQTSVLFVHRLTLLAFSLGCSWGDWRGPTIVVAYCDLGGKPVCCAADSDDEALREAGKAEDDRKYVHGSCRTSPRPRCRRRGNDIFQTSIVSDFGLLMEQYLMCS